MLFTMLGRSFRTFFSPNLVGLAMKIALLTLIAFGLFMSGAVTLILSYNPFQFDEYKTAANIGVSIFAIFVSWFLLPTLIPAIASFFQERIANRIEEREYPDYIPPAIEQSLAREVWEDCKFTLLLIGLNIVILPLLLTPIWPFAYFLLNAHLIGREFFETAAARHIGKVEAKALRRRHRLATMLAGGMIVGVSLTPVLFLTAPFIGVALAVHLFHTLAKQEKIQILPPKPSTI